MSTVECRACGEQTDILPCYDDRHRSFDPAPQNDPDIPQKMRWLAEPGRGMTPVDMAWPTAYRWFKIRHRCTRARVGYGAAEIIGERLPAVVGPDMPENLAEGFRLGYRWLNRSHIIRTGGAMALCGSRADYGEQPREMERARSLPGCAQCLSTYTSKLRALDDREHGSGLWSDTPQ